MELSNAVAPLRYTGLFIVLLLTQVLICNNLLLFGVAIPFVFIYLIIVLPLGISLNVLMAVSFFLGFFVDLFCDTMGLNCLACLILAVIKKPVFYAYIPRDDKYKNAVPSITSMGWPDYIKFTLTLGAIFSFLIFGIELFSFASFGRIIVMALTSTLFTEVLLLAVDAIFNRPKNES